MESVNSVDKYGVRIKKNDVVVGHSGDSARI